MPGGAWPVPDQKWRVLRACIVPQTGSQPGGVLAKPKTQTKRLAAFRKCDSAGARGAQKCEIVPLFPLVFNVWHPPVPGGAQTMPQPRSARRCPALFGVDAGIILIVRSLFGVACWGHALSLPERASD